MECFQLDLFKTEEQSEIDALRFEITAIKTSTDKVRKKLFAENGKLTKKMLDLESRMQIIERNICRPEPIDLNFTL